MHVPTTTLANERIIISALKTAESSTRAPPAQQAGLDCRYAARLSCSGVRRSIGASAVAFRGKVGTRRNGKGGVMVRGRGAARAKRLQANTNKTQPSPPVPHPPPKKKEIRFTRTTKHTSMNPVNDLESAGTWSSSVSTRAWMAEKSVYTPCSD